MGIKKSKEESIRDYKKHQLCGNIKRLMTIDELSEKLQIPKSWIYERTRTGEIPTVPNLGKYKRFDPDVISKWLSLGYLENEYGRIGRS